MNGKCAALYGELGWKWWPLHQNRAILDIFSLLCQRLLLLRPFSSHLFAYCNVWVRIWFHDGLLTIFGWKPHHLFTRPGLCVYCKSVFSFALLFFLIFVCLSNWLFSPFMLLFPTTPLFDPFPLSDLCLSPSLFSHCLPSLLLSFTPPRSLFYVPDLNSFPLSCCCSLLFSNLYFCLSFCFPPPVSSLVIPPSFS